MYICTKCGIPKPNEEYTRRNKIKNGRPYGSICKVCQKFDRLSGRKRTLERIRSSSNRKAYRVTVIFNSSKGNAKRRGIEHTITKQYIEELLIKQNYRCYYTGLPMKLNIVGEKNSDESISIDRIDSSKGYIVGNIALCRWIVNRAKNDLSIEQFLEIAEQIKFHMNDYPTNSE